MVSTDQARRLALSLPESVEQDHHGRPSFRVAGRIFATLWDEDHMNVMLDEPGIRTAVQAHPGVCTEVMWGKRLAAVRVTLAAADRELLADLLGDAWEGKAPARLRPATPAPTTPRPGHRDHSGASTGASGRGKAAPRSSPPAAERCLTGRRPASGPDGRPRAVVFDLGGVLLDWNPRHLYRRLFDDEAEMELFLSEVCTLEWHRAHDLGVPPEETSPPLIAAHPEHAEMIRAWTERSEEMLAGPIEDSVEILRRLKAADVPIYALTNMESWTYPGRRERYPFLRWFDGTVVSGFEGVAKPDPRIFALLLDRFGLLAETTLLIDDSKTNVRAARAAGIQAIEFESPASLRRQLEEVGLLDGRAG